MPRLSYFYGIAIYVYCRDHAPPHFHAVYGSNDAEVARSDHAGCSKVTFRPVPLRWSANGPESMSPTSCDI